MEIIFADLTHIGHNCNAVPYGISLVAANAVRKYGSEISASLVKKPTELSALLEKRKPEMVCFSISIWNVAISHAFAVRIKERYPDCIIVFGGPHYPCDVNRQSAYLQRHPEVDFFVFREGESSFVKLYQALKQINFEVPKIKEQGLIIPGCHYWYDNVLYAGKPLPLIDPLDSLPSPYLMGLCDTFLAQGYAAILQTVRGCPFTCTYCQEGPDYFNVIRRFSEGRVTSELHHIAGIAAASTLLMADSNFGMYSGDIKTAEVLKDVQEKNGWPGFVVSISGKNNKERVLKAAATISGGMFSAAIQSSDPDVLDNIKRSNVSIKELIESATVQNLHDTHSFSELIVALPGDSLRAHRKSAADLIDAGIHVVRSHQLLMLPGAEVASVENRNRFGLKTRFRVIHNTVNTYSLFGKIFHAPEVDEICVSSNTMSFQDYLECRCYDLTVEIFYNNGIFAELHAFLKLHGISISSFVMKINERVRDNSRLAELYSDFLEDTQELWETREELEKFLRSPGVLDRYKNGELGRNEQLAYKALALFENMDELIALSYGVAADLLSQNGHLSPRAVDYLDQLMRFDLLRKLDPLSADEDRSGLLHYDFCGLTESGFNKLPWGYRLNEESRFLFSHTVRHKRFVSDMETLLKTGLHGYATVISTNPKIREYFREASMAGST
jgi:radical SAM superfamily enzyme YgiQ (UPF0313 family)